MGKENQGQEKRVERVFKEMADKKKKDLKESVLWIQRRGGKCFEERVNKISFGCETDVYQNILISWYERKLQSDYSFTLFFFFPAFLVFMKKCESNIYYHSKATYHGTLACSRYCDHLKRIPGAQCLLYLDLEPV